MWTLNTFLTKVSTNKKVDNKNLHHINPAPPHSTTYVTLTSTLLISRLHSSNQAWLQLAYLEDLCISICSKHPKKMTKYFIYESKSRLKIRKNPWHFKSIIFIFIIGKCIDGEQNLVAMSIFKAALTRLAFCSFLFH